MAVIKLDGGFAAFPISYERGNPIPLDKSSVWYDNTNLDNYVKNTKGDATAYIGQYLSLVDTENLSAIPYFISGSTTKTRILDERCAEGSNTNGNYNVLINETSGKLSVNVPWTDENVKQTSDTTNKDIGILLAGVTSSGSAGGVKISGVTINPSTNHIKTTGTVSAGKLSIDSDATTIDSGNIETTGSLTVKGNINLGDSGYAKTGFDTLKIKATTRLFSNFRIYNSTDSNAEEKNITFKVMGDSGEVQAKGNIVSNSSIGVGKRDDTEGTTTEGFKMEYNSNKKAIKFVFY